MDTAETLAGKSVPFFFESSAKHRKVSLGRKPSAEGYRTGKGSMFAQIMRADLRAEQAKKTCKSWKFLDSVTLFRVHLCEVSLKYE